MQISTTFQSEGCVERTRGNQSERFLLILMNFVKGIFASGLPNPGKYEDISKEALGAFRLVAPTGLFRSSLVSNFSCPLTDVLTQNNFEGLKFDITKPMNNFSPCAITHSLALMPPVPSKDGQPDISRDSYAFGAQLQHPHHILIGRMENRNMLIGRYMYMRSRFVGGIQGTMLQNPPNSQLVMEADWRGDDYTISTKFSPPPNVLLELAYLQSVTQQLSLGVEMMHQRRGLQAGTYLTAGCRHVDIANQAIFSGQIHTGGLLSASYARQVNNRLALSASFMMHLSGESEVSAGYQMAFANGSIVKGSLSSSGKVSGYVEETLIPGVKLLISGVVDHWSKDHRFGVGISVGA